jgi:hypothetical protein
MTPEEVAALMRLIARQAVIIDRQQQRIAQLKQERQKQAE